jgi:ribonuclease D
MRYAADDVIYLPQVFRNLRSRLEEKGRLAWPEGDFRRLVDPQRYEPNPRERFWHLKKCSTLNRRQMAAAREVAAWREERAIELDLPRKWVLSDEQVVEACKRETRTIDQLMLVRGMREKLSTENARVVVRLIRRGLDSPKEDWPAPPRSVKGERNVDNEVDLMTALVRKRAKENDIAFQTLASREELQAIARGHRTGVGLMEGWRYEIVGRELLDLLAGEVSLSLSGHDLLVSRVVRGEEPEGGLGLQ